MPAINQRLDEGLDSKAPRGYLGREVLGEDQSSHRLAHGLASPPAGGESIRGEMLEPGSMAGRRGAERKPMIIVGTGRCGSTMLHRLLALHDDVGWLSTFNEVLPTQTWLSVFSRLYRAPLPARLKELKGFPKPFEAYRFWEHYLPGFSRRDRPQTADDVAADGIEPVRRATARIVTVQRRTRLLVKVTGWSRMAYFDRIYPDARF
ncbi:MAG: hypothetical protein GEU88_15500, partial [Solirubrobacterales bacterium]|nr:hypothetical protein [Solirubrobacterales bacterium]